MPSPEGVGLLRHLELFLTSVSTSASRLS
jgi:hypothetical protein